MPNTKSAERRARNSARRSLRNRSSKSQLSTLERGFRSLVQAGKKEDAAGALRRMTAALDKASKTGTIHASTASRKKSRLALLLNRAK